MNGNSQAVRLPKAFRVPDDADYIRRQGNEVILFTHAPSWDCFCGTHSAFGEDFLAERDDNEPQERELS